jgi:hypothetical protein
MSDTITCRSNNVKHQKQQYQQPPSCLLCYSVEMTMMDLFSMPADLDYEGIVAATTTRSDGCNKFNDHDNNNNNFYSGTNFCLMECKQNDDDDFSSSSSSLQASTDLEWPQDTSSVARKVCKMWRKRRRQEKEKTKHLLRQQQQQQQQAEPGVPVMPSSSSSWSTSPTTITKTMSLKMLHPNTKPYDEMEDDFHRPLERTNNAAIVDEGQMTRHHVRRHKGMNRMK